MQGYYIFCFSSTVRIILESIFFILYRNEKDYHNYHDLSEIFSLGTKYFEGSADKNALMFTPIEHPDRSICFENTY